ncbi:cilia- and flagella-associated protein 221-like isoform X2 [Belonocnema kinseyi]|nr:cilia- and flagella-associated protein 221-like isoform X2 [Belonocnema kinseyi]
MKTQQKIVQITNYSSKPCPLLISPPGTCYFKITSKTLKEWLNPGYSFELKIRFIPDEIRHYHDSIKIQEFEKRYSILKLSAAPSCEINYPKTVDFGKVPLAATVSYKIPIHSDPMKKISFAVFPLSEIQCCLHIYPLYGSLKPGQNPIFLNVEYQALRYITATFQIQLFIPEICKSPFLINFIAYTYPGLQREKLEEVIEVPLENQKEPKKTNSVSEPIKLENKITSTSLHFSQQKKEKKKIQNYEYKLFKKLGKIPAFSLHGVNLIMNARLKKVHDEFELRGPLSMYKCDTMKEKMNHQNEFLHKSEQLLKLNENARNNHKPKLGESLSDSYNEKFDSILAKRKQHSFEYKNKLITTTKEELLQRPKVIKIRQRTLRSCTENFEKITTHQLSCDWFLRYTIIAHFIQAARIIILKNRLKKVLSLLRKLTPEIVERIEKLIDKERN